MFDIAQLKLKLQCNIYKPKCPTSSLSLGRTVENLKQARATKSCFSSSCTSVHSTCSHQLLEIWSTAASSCSSLSGTPGNSHSVGSAGATAGACHYLQWRVLQVGNIHRIMGFSSLLPFFLFGEDWQKHKGVNLLNQRCYLLSGHKMKLAGGSFSVLGNMTGIPWSPQKRRTDWSSFGLVRIGQWVHGSVLASMNIFQQQVNDISRSGWYDCGIQLCWKSIYLEEIYNKHGNHTFATVPMSTPDSDNVTFGSKPSKWQQQSSPLAHCRKVSTWTSSKWMGGINMLDTYFSW